MKPSESNSLLRAVLYETMSDELREASLATALRAAGRRRRLRRARQTVMAAGLIALVLFAFRHLGLPEHGARGTLPPHVNVRTGTAPRAAVVTTTRFDRVTVTRPNAVAVVSTRDGGAAPKWINDEQLLAFAGPGAVLVAQDQGDGRTLLRSDGNDG